MQGSVDETGRGPGWAGRVLFAAILGLAAGTAALLVLLHYRALPHFGARPGGGRMAGMPRVTLWAWDRPAFLGDLKKEAVAVAYLDQTVVLTAAGAWGRPRLAPVVFPEGGKRVAVVRIEASPGAVLTQPVVEQVVEMLLRSAMQPKLAALQVDFDARPAERVFYRMVLKELRGRMPAGLPLSMTALPSWCGYDDWIQGLPVDEAVPMFFRMEPEWQHTSLDASGFQMREPLCAGSIGLSAREPWPRVAKGRRLYVFAEYGWSPAAIESVMIRTE